MNKKYLGLSVITIFISLTASLAMSNIEELANTAEKMSSCAATFIVAQSAGLIESEEVASELKRRVTQMGLVSTYLVKIQDENLTPSEAAVQTQKWLTNQMDIYTAIKKLQGSEVMLDELTSQIQECAAIFPVADSMSPLIYEDAEFINYINELPKT